MVVLMGTSMLAQGPTYRHRPHADAGRNPRQGHLDQFDRRRTAAGTRKRERRGAGLSHEGVPGLSRGRGTGGTAPILKSAKGPETDTWERGRVLPVRAPFATIVWDYINRGMPLGREGTLTADEVYALTAYLLAINQVIPEDQVLDRESLPKVKMPLSEREYALVPSDWKPKTRRLKDYPF